MPGSLFRYLLRELAWPFVLWVFFLLLFLFVMQFLRGTEVFLGSAVTPRDMGLLCLYLGPSFLTMAVPVAFLLALLLGFGRLGEDRELLALHALGMGPAEVLRAPLALALALGGLMALLGWVGTPWGMGQVREHLNEIIKRNVVGDVKSGTFYEDLTQLTVYVEKVEDNRRRWRNVLLHDDRDPASPLLVLARTGRVNPLVSGEALKILLEQGEVHRVNRAEEDYAKVEFEKGELAVGVADNLRKKNRFRSSREEMTPGELLQAADATGKEGGDARPFLMTYHVRWGQVLTPLAFMLLAAPLAMGGRRVGRSWGFLLSLAGYILYYVLMRAFENLGQQGKLPFLLAAQLPNLLFAAFGIAALVWTTRTGRTA